MVFLSLLHTRLVTPAFATVRFAYDVHFCRAIPKVCLISDTDGALDGTLVRYEVRLPPPAETLRMPLCLFQVPPSVLNRSMSGWRPKVLEMLMVLGYVGLSDSRLSLFHCE
ncbi:hypothetical protein FA13DRAFT_166209 [Coprinellus micaceus]|uniref:Secreted protein n=1 Tax=Coprinellus micaceus TaxID=71717 RepID=A0A4Y7SH46_COPMI|nr:hypothetical protein FA13DRAFT_166209 [Coprinellus micaceus]